MKTCLTLLAAISALSAYTLMGVHCEQCAVCPINKLGTAKLIQHCTKAGTTTCKCVCLEPVVSVRSRQCLPSEQVQHVPQQ
ncbi:hypothetical protein PAXRUDRAFT_827995 [Paxillus rubicundulus Ve08.2h10]|uniref:Unplaced genomic scaffold scaffold_285, whole genome shotgun sequence n=1 Tax=Paxillus rubicundulus Ve08.2h10 TaxID=930991 RepID=A0A0D0DQ95_9AGAM|nr:hypothetical protein PAXRUDRAFT_827995 [Paxillus rubicundulus Ve08.2h10]